MTNKKIFITIITLIFFIPLIHAGDYGDLKYGKGVYGIGEPSGDGTPGPSTGPGGGPGGGGTPSKKDYECYFSIDCKQDQYCFEHKCYDAECFDDTVCEKDELCKDHRCVKLFDVEILEFDSPIRLGEFFEFTYFIKGMAEINDDVEIKFWIEKNGEIVTSGQDTIYMGNYEQKTKKTKLFLPSNTISGSYTFYVQVKHEKYAVESHRTIEIKIEDGLAKIGLTPERGLKNYMIPFLIILIILILIFILYLKRKKIKETFTIKKRLIKENLISTLAYILLAIFALLAYFLGLFQKIIDWIRFSNLSMIHYVLFGIIALLIVIIIILTIIKKKNKFAKKRVGKNKFFKQLERWKNKGYNTEILERKLKNIKKTHILFAVALISLIGVLTINYGNITGFIINNGNFMKKTFIKKIFWAIISSTGLIFLSLYYNKARELIINKLPKRKKHKKRNIQNILNLKNKKVYTTEGDYIGKITDIILEKNKINNLKIKLPKKRKSIKEKIKKIKKKKSKTKTKKIKGILIKYKHVIGVGEVIIVDERILDKIEEHNLRE